MESTMNTADRQHSSALVLSFNHFLSLLQLHFLFTLWVKIKYLKHTVPVTTTNNHNSFIKLL